MIVNSAIHTVSDLRKVGGKEWGKFLDKVGKSDGSERICDSFKTKGGKTVFYIYQPSETRNGVAYLERQVHNGEHSICKAHTVSSAFKFDDSRIIDTGVVTEHSYRGDVLHYSRRDGNHDVIKIHDKIIIDPNFRSALIYLNSDLQKAKSIKGLVWSKSSPGYTKIDETSVTNHFVANLVEYIRTGKAAENVKQFITEKLGFELMK